MYLIFPLHSSLITSVFFCFPPPFAYFFVNIAFTIWVTKRRGSFALLSIQPLIRPLRGSMGMPSCHPASCFPPWTRVMMSTKTKHVPCLVEVVEVKAITGSRGLVGTFHTHIWVGRGAGVNHAPCLITWPRKLSIQVWTAAYLSNSLYRFVLLIPARIPPAFWRLPFSHPYRRWGRHHPAFGMVGPHCGCFYNCAGLQWFVLTSCFAQWLPPYRPVPSGQNVFCGHSELRGSSAFGAGGNIPFIFGALRQRWGK